MIATSEPFAVKASEAEKFGCPHCGYRDIGWDGSDGQTTSGRCGECGGLVIVCSDALTQSSIGFIGKDEPIYPKVIPHPREGIPLHGPTTEQQMKEPKIQFKCPKCGHDRLVQIRQQVEARDVVDGLIVVDSSSPGRKHNLLTSSSFHSEGKVIRFECEACKFFPTTREDWNIRCFTKNGHIGEKPIISAKHLYDWLKRHNMIGQ